jgi:hypothetical protein
MAEVCKKGTRDKRRATVSDRQEPAVGGPMFAAAKPTLVMGFA